jgi:hypothetical protein
MSRNAPLPDSMRRGPTPIDHAAVICVIHVPAIQQLKYPVAEAERDDILHRFLQPMIDAVHGFFGKHAVDAGVQRSRFQVVTEGFSITTRHFFCTAPMPAAPIASTTGP